MHSGVKENSQNQNVKLNRLIVNHFCICLHFHILLFRCNFYVTVCIASFIFGSSQVVHRIYRRGTRLVTFYFYEKNYSSIFLSLPVTIPTQTTYKHCCLYASRIHEIDRRNFVCIHFETCLLLLL